jgi:hypothetical protein
VESKSEDTAGTSTVGPSTFSVHREPWLSPASGSRIRSSGRRRRASRRPTWFVVTRWLAFAAPALALGTFVSLWLAGPAGVTFFVTPRRAVLIERAICYSPQSADYNRCIVSRDNARIRGAELLKKPMLTPYRASLCATLQIRFSVGDFWECVQALRDPHR